jgi:crotonobetainyl-CoA:carnitine CoA-transferase CaiB-like acyl-CoA transferase
VRRAGPDLGEHNEEVFGQLLGYPAHTIDDLARRGIIGDGHRQAA